MIIERTEEQIDEQLNLAHDGAYEGKTRWPGMTYEQGVTNALLWVRGDYDDAPMSDD